MPTCERAQVGQDLADLRVRLPEPQHETALGHLAGPERPRVAQQAQAANVVSLRTQ